MYTRPSPALARRRLAGTTLVDVLFAIGLTGLLMVVIVGVMQFSGRSFLCLANYIELDDRNRLAIDNLTRDLRECSRVKYCSTNLLALEGTDGLTVYYEHSPQKKTLTRWKAPNSVAPGKSKSTGLQLGNGNPAAVAGAAGLEAGPDDAVAGGKSSEAAAAQSGKLETLLTGCETLSFRLYKRNTITNTYEQFPASLPTEAKVVDIAWKCTRSILGINANSEAVQTAKIVIRKQGT